MPKLFTREEARRRRMRFQIFAGMFDFIALIAGIIVVILCIILLSSLINWVRADAPGTFISLWEMFTKALIVPK